MCRHNALDIDCAYCEYVKDLSPKGVTVRKSPHVGGIFKKARKL